MSATTRVASDRDHGCPDCPADRVVVAEKRNGQFQVHCPCCPRNGNERPSRSAALKDWVRPLASGPAQSPKEAP